MKKNFETLIVEVGEKSAKLILCRPDVNNALNATMLKELIEVADWLNQQPHLQTVVIEGQGGTFCAGADIKDLPIKDALPASGKPWLERRAAGQLGKQMVDALGAIRAVTIAKVNGAAIGGGLLIMIACDFRIVAEDSVLCLPELALGIPLAWGGIPRLVREIGPVRTKELVMTCRRFTAREALEMGMVNEVCEGAELDTQVAALEAVLLQRPSVSLVLTKEHVNAAAQELNSTDNSFSDGDVLMSIAQEPEANRFIEQYISSHKRPRI